ncbi:DNA replication terminus site-binding protein [Xenorhabdus entomophaga]
MVAVLPRPKIGSLSHYDANAIKYRHQPKAQPLELVIPRLHLYHEV